TLWEMMANHQSVDKLIEVVPDEFHDWVRATVAELNARFSEIESVALADYAEVDQSLPRKAQAEYILTTRYPHLVFMMLDGKEHASAVWKMVRPERAATFREDLDA